MVEANAMVLALQGEVDAKIVGAEVWHRRHLDAQARAVAARHRELAQVGRSEAAAVRQVAASIRDDAARVRDDGARARDAAARVRDGAARVRDEAGRARDAASQTRSEATRKRLAAALQAEPSIWTEILELDRRAAEQGHTASGRDRDAAALDRDAANKDRDAAERDREAAEHDRDAAAKDHEAAEMDRRAADADCVAADSDRVAAETTLELAEARLLQTASLSALGQMTVGIGHEINNPLSVLTMALASVQEEAKARGESCAWLLPIVTDAQEATTRIGHVVSDMKAWLAGPAAPTPVAPVDFARLVRDTLRLTFHRVNAVATTVVDVRTVRQIVSVESRLSQVLSNLVLNASQAMSGPKEGNELRVSVHDDEDAGVLLRVSDTGAGIPPKALPHLFEPLFTLREGGSGLGLAICSAIVVSLGGTLTAQNNATRGATFTVRLPPLVA